MQEPSLPVLIVAQSGRYLAQSATQAGHTVWVADCFGDIDTQETANRWLKLPAFSILNSNDLLEQLCNFVDGHKCLLICGSGIEIFYPILPQLPENIHYFGNSSHTIEKIKNPAVFFSILAKHHLPYPATQYTQPNKSEAWLFKESSGLGGAHITSSNKSPKNKQGYFQQQISGESGSILFLADKDKTQSLLINKQIVTNNQTSPFQLAAIETPLEISKSHRDQLFEAIDIITKETALVGLNSLDFIIDDNNQLFILEVNPRPSASSELVNDELLFQHHLQACQGKQTFDMPITANINHAGLYYLYAPHTLTIPHKMNWPKHSYDIPQQGTTINADQPICTIIVADTEIERCQQQQQKISKKILQQLTSSS